MAENKVNTGDGQEQNNNKMLERRKFPRLDCEVDVQYKIKSELPAEKLKKDLFENKSINVTPLGICIKTHEKLPIDTILELKIIFPEKTIEAISRVAWSSDVPGKCCSGLEFIAIKDTYLDSLTHCIAECYMDKHQLNSPEHTLFLKDIFLSLSRAAKKPEKTQPPV